MTKKRPKPNIASTTLLKSLQDNNLKLNLIDGEEESFESINPETPIEEGVREEKQVDEIFTQKKDDRVTSTTTSKKRNNVPIYEEQYWALNLINKVTDITITQLVREGLEYIIQKYNKEFGEDIKRVQQIQDKLRESKKSTNN